MRLTVRQLNRATLARQLLLDRKPLGVVDGLRRVVALQAQEAASPYLALWNRLDPFDPADLDAAFIDQRLIKASLMRMTLHAVEAADYPAFHDAMQRNLRASRLGDARFTSAGLTTAEADALVPLLVAHLASPRTNADVEAFLHERVGEGKRPAWWAIRTFGPWMHAPTGGTWSFGPRPAYRAAPPHSPPQERSASVQHVVRRYLEGFGPATIQDIAAFALIQRPIIRDAIRAMEEELVTFQGPDGIDLFDVPGGLLPAEDTHAPPRLMAMWDSVLLAYSDRSRIIPPQHRKLVTRMNGDVLPTLLVDGHVAGVWRPVEGGIEATAFETLSRDSWAGLETEAVALVTFLADRDPMVYRRYGHWWARLPEADVRLLGR